MIKRIVLSDTPSVLSFLFLITLLFVSSFVMSQGLGVLSLQCEAKICKTNYTSLLLSHSSNLAVPTNVYLHSRETWLGNSVYNVHYESNIRQARVFYTDSSFSVEDKKHIVELLKEGAKGNTIEHTIYIINLMGISAAFLMFWSIFMLYKRLKQARYPIIVDLREEFVRIQKNGGTRYKFHPDDVKNVGKEQFINIIKHEHPWIYKTGVYKILGSLKMLRGFTINLKNGKSIIVANTKMTDADIEDAIRIILND